MNDRTTRSGELFKLGETILPGGVSSPIRACREVASEPVFIDRGEGQWVYDVDGNRYVDFMCGLGPLILGHSPACVTRAIEEQAARGTVFATGTEVEYRLAQMILESTPCLERLRFVCSGTEATMSALRVAKAFTHRPMLMKFNGSYHGHADALLGRRPGTQSHDRSSQMGIDSFIRENTIIVEYNDVHQAEAAFSAHGQNLAAVFVEPYACNMGLVKPLPGFLEALRRGCDETGALLIFDEVVVGFRFRFGSVSPELGVEPDLVTFGKIIGGGTPIGAYGGKTRYMSLLNDARGVFQGGTFAGNPLSMAAGIAMLRALSADGFYERLEQLGRRLTTCVLDGFKQHRIPYACSWKGSVFSFVFAEDHPCPVNALDVQEQDFSLYSQFHLEMLRRGFLLPPSAEEPLFISAAHSDQDVSSLATNAVEVIAALRDR